MRLKPEAFARFAPNALPGMLEAIEAAAAKYDLKGLPLAHWLGQMHVESAGFTTLTENLNYSVEGLLNTFGGHRISEADCQKFGRSKAHPANPSAIANIIYGGEWGRKNLGNTQPGDGWRFRGSGVKQITGRANIEASGFTPEELRTDFVKSCEAAAHFFRSHGCVPYAERDDVEGVTLCVNGGYNGLADRKARTLAAKQVLA